MRFHVNNQAETLTAGGRSILEAGEGDARPRSARPVAVPPWCYCLGGQTSVPSPTQGAPPARPRGPRAHALGCPEPAAAAVSWGPSSPSATYLGAGQWAACPACPCGGPLRASCLLEFGGPRWACSAVSPRAQGPAAAQWASVGVLGEFLSKYPFMRLSFGEKACLNF